MSAPLAPETVAIADVAVVLLVALLVGRFTRRLHQPPVVAEILTGILLGPSLLGLLPGHLPAHLFPDQSRSLLNGIAQVGLVVFMFLAGWELDLRSLRGRGRWLGATAGLTMAVPFAVGAGAGALLVGGFGPKGVSHGDFVLYLATAFSITAFPVLARVLRDNGLSRSRVGNLAMACAAVGDVLAWCLLVLVVALVSAKGQSQFWTVLAETAGYGLVLVVVVRPLLSRLVDRAGARGGYGTLFTATAAGLMLSAYATGWIGIHTIFGAFAFGLVMPRRPATELHEQLGVPMERLAALLLPVYFVVTGLSVDVSALGGRGLVALLVVLAAAVSGKAVGAVVPVRLSGLGWRESLAFGALMNTRGLTELVVLGIGRQLGLITGEMFTIMVLMALLTTAMAGPLLRALRMVPAAVPGRAEAETVTDRQPRPAAVK
ncbi:cation:proton antiporter [Streptacidiphilus jiangxiensis]|uniref:Kef-type K+ transport system, membrane component KefB n=1 Tax=Streptacidiphilus jiangxiensis TaxID=235985 RepID=A0A1H7KIY9_STRJI|nr:cation:proton antiporter [Streptacidiphilus jiangxiensis]SEK86490.1 Kef-type K+ transport system, membrane component KefB [Streptacidiphilus jiangxiensis]